MEQHPVPQNVTTFQFRLIGDMTIKQFGYLAGGAILAYLSYKLPLPFFFTWPLAITCGVGGFGLAFVPIEERPMDIWVLAFIKSVYSPTQFVWKKEQVAPRPTPPQSLPQPVRTTSPITQAGRPKTDILQGLFNGKSTTPSLPTLNKVVTAKTQISLFDRIMNFIDGKPTPAATFTAQHTVPLPPIPSVTGKHFDYSLPPIVTKPSPKVVEEVKEKEKVLEHKMEELKTELASKTMTESRILELQKQLTEVLGERDRMEKELEAFRKQAAPAPPPAVVPQKSTSHATTVAAQKQPTVNIITPEGAVKAGLPRLTTFPNVVTGIVKDGERNLLPGVLVTVKDKEGLPLRALKTNRLGQFAASTPLTNGVYFIEVEDPRMRYTFDRVQITFNGTVVPALEIIAKSQKELTRAKLTKELFGNQTS